MEQTWNETGSWSFVGGAKGRGDMDNMERTSPSPLGSLFTLLLQIRVSFVFYTRVDLWMNGLGFKFSSNEGSVRRVLITVSAVELVCAIKRKGEKGKEILLGWDGGDWEV